MKRKGILALLLAVGVTTFGNSGLSVLASTKNLSTVYIEDMSKREVDTDSISKIFESDYAMYRNLGPGGFEYCNSLEKVSDGNYLMSAYIREEKIVKINSSDLSTLWEVSLGGNVIKKVIEASDGSIISVGCFRKKDTSEYAEAKNFQGYSAAKSKGANAMIVKLNSAGVVQNGRIFSSVGDDAITDIIETKDGGFLLLMHSNTSSISVNSDGSKAYSYIKKLSSNFVEEWTYKLTENIPVYLYSSAFAKNVTELDNGDFLIRDISLSGSSYVANKLVRVSSSGSLVWSKEYENSLLVDFLVDGDKVVAYGSEKVNDGTCLSVYSINATNGELENKFNYFEDLNLNYKLNKYDTGKTIAKAEDGGYIIAGGSYTSGYDCFVLKLGTNFELKGFYDIESDITNDGFESILIDGSKVVLVGSFSNTVLGPVTGSRDTIVFSVDLQESKQPTVVLQDDGRVRLEDNNDESLKKDLYYRYKVGSQNMKSNWTLYTEPFLPTYDSSGSLNLEVKSVNIFGKESGVLEHSEINEDYVETETNKNIDVVFTVEDMLALTYEDSEVNFGKINGLKPVESTDKVTINVTSTANWDMNIKGLTDFNGTATGSVVGIDKLSAKANEEGYVQLEKGVEKALLSDQAPGDNIQVSVGFKLEGLEGVKSDTYKATTRLTVTQK